MNLSMTKCQAVVIKTINLGENDKIITILTDKLGKVDVVAHGCRKPKSRFMASTQPFCYGEYVIYKGKNLYTLNDSNIIDSFQSIIMDLDKLAYGSYFLELVDALTEREVKNVSMLALILKTFYIIVNTDINLKLLKVTVNFKAVSLAGYKPQINYCLKCKTPINEGYFNISEGGILCKKCASSKHVYKIDNAAMDFLHMVRNIKLEDLRNINYSENVLDYIDSLLANYINYHIDREFKTLELIKKI